MQKSKLFFLENTDSNHKNIKEVLDKYYRQDLDLCFEKDKKPYIKNSTDIFFNYSHSYDLLLLATNNKQIGVDIEKIRAIDVALMNKAFSKREIDYILSNTKEDQFKAFLEIWTKKESYIKFLGKNIFYINKFDVFSITDAKINTDIYIFDNNNIKEKYIYSVCGTE